MTHAQEINPGTVAERTRYRKGTVPSSSGNQAAEGLETRPAGVSPCRIVASLRFRKIELDWNRREAQPLYSTPECE